MFCKLLCCFSFCHCIYVLHSFYRLPFGIFTDWYFYRLPFDYPLVFLQITLWYFYRLPFGIFTDYTLVFLQITVWYFCRLPFGIFTDYSLVFLQITLWYFSKECLALTHCVFFQKTVVHLNIYFYIFNITLQRGLSLPRWYGSRI